MSVHLNSTTRRNAIQQMAFAMAGLSLFSLGSCSAAEGDHEVKSIKKLTPYYLPPMEPLEPGPGGLNIRTLIRSSQTNMQFSNVETVVAPKQMGPAPHVHQDLDEIMFVLDGVASVMVGGKVTEVQAGGWHIRPHGIEHTFWNATDKQLRFVDMYFNQNFEDYLEELIHKIIPDMAERHLTPADPAIAARMAALDKKFGVTMFPEKRQAIIDRYGLKST